MQKHLPSLSLTGFSLISLLACTCNRDDEDTDSAAPVVTEPGCPDADGTLIAYDYESSVHEMITCGQLTMQITRAVFNAFEAVLGNGSQQPDGWTYADGRFTTEGNNTTMVVTFLYGPGTDAGAEGDQIMHNLFEADTFLVDPVTTIDLDDFSVSISYDAPGALAGVLGQGDDPPNPITIDTDTLSSVASFLNSLQMQSFIRVNNRQSASVVTYDVGTDVVSIADLSGFEYKLTRVTASREDLGQSMETAVWDITYDDEVQDILGSIEAGVSGGPYPFDVTYTYTGGEPAIDITCLD